LAAAADEFGCGVINKLNTPGVVIAKTKIGSKKLEPKYFGRTDLVEQIWSKFKIKSSLASKNDPFLVANRPKTTIFWRLRSLSGEGPRVWHRPVFDRDSSHTLHCRQHMTYIIRKYVCTWIHKHLMHTH
jgi:hypothetical protein